MSSLGKKEENQVNESDRRSIDRVALDLTVVMWRNSGFITRKMDSTVVNISLGGCRLKFVDLQSGFAVGEKIKVQFITYNATTKKSKKVTVVAQVRWASADGSEIGCQFEKLKPTSLAFLNKVISVK